jgi:hypothetical protein
MTMKTWQGMAAAGLLLAGGGAQAALVPYTANGVDLVYDAQPGASSTQGLTWTANANLAATETFGVTGINANGTMSWAKALEWIAAMNAANYAGANDWRLWSALNSDGSGPCEPSGLRVLVGHGVRAESGRRVGLRHRQWLPGRRQ